MSLIKQIALRDGRITNISITPGKAGVPEAAKAAAKKARERAGGEKDPADRLTELYAEIVEAMSAVGAKMPNHTTPLANASRPDLMRVMKRAEETSDALRDKVESLVTEILILRDQVKNRERLQDAIQS